jgi:hypothetical protein
MFSPAVRSENSVFWKVKKTVRKWFKRCRKSRRFRERFGRKRVVVKAVPFFCITITLSVSDLFILEPVNTIPGSLANAHELVVCEAPQSHRARMR